MVRRPEEQIEQRLTRMQVRCEKPHRDPMKVEREIGRRAPLAEWSGQNTRAARLFEVTVRRDEQGFAQKKVQASRDWATLGAGCYLLRTNVADWSDEESGNACIQLTEAEAAFRIHKERPENQTPSGIKRKARVLAHIFVCFLAYVL